MSDYGVTSLAADALATFRKALEADKDKTLQYLTRKLGYDASSDSETQMAYAVYEDIDVITTGKQKTGEFICVMHNSLTPDEYETCVAAAHSVDDAVFL